MRRLVLLSGLLFALWAPAAPAEPVSSASLAPYGIASVGGLRASFPERGRIAGVLTATAPRLQMTVIACGPQGCATTRSTVIRGEFSRRFPVGATRVQLVITRLGGTRALAELSLPTRARARERFGIRRFTGTIQAASIALTAGDDLRTSLTLRTLKYDTGAFDLVASAQCGGRVCPTALVPIDLGSGERLRFERTLALHAPATRYVRVRLQRRGSRATDVAGLLPR